MLSLIQLAPISEMNTLDQILLATVLIAVGFVSGLVASEMRASARNSTATATWPQAKDIESLEALEAKHAEAAESLGRPMADSLLGSAEDRATPNPNASASAIFDDQADNFPDEDYAGHWPIAPLQRRFLDAVRQVETSSQPLPVPRGDDGRAFGPYQIHQAYAIDGLIQNPDFYGSAEQDYHRAHAQCESDTDLSETIVAGYMTRYASDAWAVLEEHQYTSSGTLNCAVFKLAATHNGGPRGPEKEAAHAYARKVLAEFNGSFQTNPHTPR